MLIQVLRMHHSSYFSPQFLQHEQGIVEQFAPFKYLTKLEEIDPLRPIILITNTHFRPSSFPTNLWGQVEMIIHPNSGYDNFPDDFLRTLHCPIVLGQKIRAQAVAEYILSCLFHHYTPIKNQENWAPTRRWNRPILRELNILQLGFGEVGHYLESMLAPLVNKEKYLLCDPQYPMLTPLEKVMHRKFDVILLAASLNSSSFQIINRAFLQHLASKELCIVNAARGELIHEGDLQQFLLQNPDSHAYIDVFDPEPKNFTPLNTIPNLTKTSHMAGVFRTLEEETLHFIAESLKNFLETQIDDIAEGEN